MDDLITWLRAQLNYDERDSERVHYSLCSAVALRSPGHPCDCGFPDQRRVEVDAKRRVIQAWENANEIAHEPHGQLVVATRYGLEVALRALALPYADRPGYRDEWKP